jgi:hypothetical protein
MEEMDARTLKGFRSVVVACNRILQDRVAEGTLEILFSAVRELDDELQSLSPATFRNTESIVTARSALASAMWSMYPTSVLKRTAAMFRHLQRVIACLAELVLKDKPAQHTQIEGLVEKLAERLAIMDYDMTLVFDVAPYVTSLYVQPQHAQKFAYLPAMDDEVRCFVVFFPLRVLAN